MILGKRYFALMKFSWISGKWGRVLIHAAVWTLLFLLPIFLQQSFNERKLPVTQQVDSSGLKYHQVINFLTWVGLFYLNSYLLLPYFFNKKKYNQYILSVVGVLSLLFCFNWISYYILVPDNTFRLRGFIFFYLLPCLFVLAISGTYKMFEDKIREDQQKAQKVTENLKTELAFLRSQVSPHFMFNVLNNMVALARKGSDQLEPSLIKLSSLLRYMLYETDEEKVSLQKEIEYLQSYVDLQRQRFGKNVAIKSCMSKVDADYQIEPMLLIPFVENAFKHGTGWIENAEIEIELKAEKNLLTFNVRNKMCNGQEIKDKTSGIGLSNVQRRLNLLYAGNHSLLMTRQDDRFIVSLQIVLG